MFTCSKEQEQARKLRRVDAVKRVLNFENEENSEPVCLNDVIIFPVDNDLMRLAVPVLPEEQSNTSQGEETAPKTLTRKRTKNPDKWKKNMMKKLREKGEEYVDCKGKLHTAKSVKQRCSIKCNLQCKQINDEERKNIHDDFYSLSDAKKNAYYNKFTKRVGKVRKRTTNENSRRKNTFRYFFPLHGIILKVCQIFFCATLSISKGRIHYFHQHFSNADLSLTPKKGKTGHKSTSKEKINEVKAHINSFAKVESHYCRNSTKREYLDANLSIKKMYDLYESIHADPVKENIYRKIFNEDFNLSFFKPKKDVCDACCEYKMIKDPTSVQETQHKNHLKRKQLGKTEKDCDRNNTNENTAVVTFDLENVIPLPKANVSCFFYKSKLNVYNLTAFCDKNKTAYNCMWNEVTSGRAGNDIASSLVKILTHVTKDLPNLTKVILWSDSCVPQNRNSFMSTAIMNFLNSASHKIETVIQKFSEPGHGNLQEVDAVHSLIERHMRHLEIYSPVSLMRSLKKLKSKSLTFKFIQMAKDDFMVFSEFAKKHSFTKIPYSQVKQIVYIKNNCDVQYKLGFDIVNDTTVSVLRTNTLDITSVIIVKEGQNEISMKKVNDIISMYKFMPPEDKLFYVSIFKNVSFSKTSSSSSEVPVRNNETTKTKNPKVEKNKEPIAAPPTKKYNPSLSSDNIQHTSSLGKKSKNNPKKEAKKLKSYPAAPKIGETKGRAKKHKKQF